MGIINAENQLSFRSTSEMFARVKKRLSSFNSVGLIDDNDFYDYVRDIYGELGLGVFKECEAILHVKNGKVKLPGNMMIFHAAFKCEPYGSAVPSINEQKPWIYYTDTEISKGCVNKCCIECTPAEANTKIVIRTFVNGDEKSCYIRGQRPLMLSPNVKAKCTEECLSMFCASTNEITIDDDRYLHTMFEKGSVYIQYYGIPFDENELPMVPDNTFVELALEYYIYSKVFETWYWNNSVPNIVQALQDVRNQYSFNLEKAKYWAVLPSFQRTIQAIRRLRSRNKFYYSSTDRTTARGSYY